MFICVCALGVTGLVDEAAAHWVLMDCSLQREVAQRGEGGEGGGHQSISCQPDLVEPIAYRPVARGPGGAHDGVMMGFRRNHEPPTQLSCRKHATPRPPWSFCYLKSFHRFQYHIRKRQHPAPRDYRLLGAQTIRALKAPGFPSGEHKLINN